MTTENSIASTASEQAADPRTAEPAVRASGASDGDRIARRAYDLYLARGGSHGAALDDWLAAEREDAAQGKIRRD